MKLVPTLLAIALAGALAAGCAPKKVPKPQTLAETAASAVAKPLPVIGPAPVWQLKDLDGRLLSSDQFRGKVVIVDFWATWCPPCREEIPMYVDLYKKYGPDKLAIIGFSVDEAGPKVVKDFMRESHINYPIALADDRVIGDFGTPEGYPTTFLIDRDGMIRDKKLGAEPADEYVRKVTSLIE